MAAIRVVWDSGRFPHFFEMLGFSDLAVPANSWDRSEGEFRNELDQIAAKLEIRRVEYARECVELPARIAAVERIFLNAWGLSDTHIRGPAPSRARRGPANATQPRRELRSQALEVRQEEMMEMEQAIIAINASAAARVTPPRRMRRYTAAEPGSQFTTFAPLASERWVEHTCQGYMHAICKMDTFNHLSPMTIKALQFIAGVSDEEALRCQEIALDGSLEHAGRTSKSIEPTDLSFSPMSYLDPDNCGDTSPGCWQKGIKQPPNLQLRSLRKVWSTRRPYLKCQCGKDSHVDCAGGPIWFDHALWFLLAHPDILFLNMSSVRVQTSMLFHFLRTSWKPTILDYITFINIRHVMMGFVKNLEQDDTLDAETVMKDQRLWDYKLPPTLAKIILRTRIPARRRSISPRTRTQRRVRNEQVQIPGQGRLNFQPIRAEHAAQQDLPPPPPLRRQVNEAEDAQRIQRPAQEQEAQVEQRSTNTASNRRREHDDPSQGSSSVTSAHLQDTRTTTRAAAAAAGERNSSIFAP
ncbi:hypothetical protein CBR_g31102 [Chara braunii]|uniref:Uncharacterized protein n=1 Tax=Chara braunii TaxID=69332 RepID=A0A388LEK4_CHABU|nr:hypothetical protein CBR_g31102 [Chara braunii]|eukprot:GBG80642.1 hypothetical protein CBR_g31102 [Chara braunii]